jgi:hypothetical protein
VPRGVIVGVVGIAVVVAVAGYLLVARSSPDTCRDGAVRVDGDCAAVRAGPPVDRKAVDAAEHIASVLIDEDPAAGSLGGRCAFQGIAGGRDDVYLCLMSYNGNPITFRLLHERHGRVYHWRLLNNPQPDKFAFDMREGETGECAYIDRSPDCD